MNRRAVLFPVAVAVIAASAWFAKSRADQPIVVPAVTWRLGTGTEIRQARNYEDVAPESPIRLALRCDEARYVYVFSHSQEDGTLLLFPSPNVKSDLAQPLAPGSPVLPGVRDGKELAWDSRRQVSVVTTFVVVAAREPVAALDALLPKLRRWSNTARTDGSMGVMNPPDGTPPIAGPRTPLPEPLLQRAADISQTATVVNGPLTADGQLPGVWIGSWRIRELPSAPPQDPLQPLKDLQKH